MTNLPVKWLWITALSLAIPGAWLLGNAQGRREATFVVAEWQAKAQTATQQHEELKSNFTKEMQQITQDRDVAQARAEYLQMHMGDSLKQSIDDAAELVLYRRIAGEQMPRGLQVDDISRVNKSPAWLTITLIQVKGRDRATGTVEVVLINRNQGQETRRVVVNAKTGALEPSIDTDNVIATTEFDLRFFQKLLVNVGDVTTIAPDLIEIVVSPRENGLDRSVQTFPWHEIRVEIAK